MRFDTLLYPLRSLRRAPGLSAIVVVTAALGIGTGTSLFSVVKAVLLNPLPYPDAGRLVWVASRAQQTETLTSLSDFDDWRAQNNTFSGMAAYNAVPLLAGGGNEPVQVTGAMVTEQFFDVLGVHPVRGREFSPAEHKPAGGIPAAILSHGLWQRIYGSDPEIIGRKITVLGMPSTVIGIMPEGFAYPAGAELWFSARALGEGSARAAHNYWVLGRLRPGASLQAADADIRTIAQSLGRKYAGPYQISDASVAGLAEHFTGSVRTPLTVLFGAVGLLLAIVCVNIANLLLVRHASRSGELAVRAALGASRSRLFTHLFTESLVLAVAGGALGLLLAAWSLDLMRIILPASLPRAAEVRIDNGVIAFAIGATLLAGIIFGTLPSWLASRLGIYEVLKGASRGSTAGRRSLRAQSALVVSEVALSVLLLAGAGLLFASFVRLRAVDPGFRTDHVLSARLSWPVNPPEMNRFPARYRELLDRVRATPGVELAGVMRALPLDPAQARGAVRMKSRPDLQGPEADYVIASAGTLETLRVPLIRGRMFNDSDTAESPRVVIVSQEMARRFWPGRDPIGEQLWFPGFEQRERWATVVGVTGDMRQNGLTEPAREQAWISYTQLPTPGYLVNANIVVRSSLATPALTASVRDALHRINPGAAATFRPMDELLAGATSRQRFQLQVLGSFAVLALLLAAIGLYGVMSYTVTSNRAAIGIRMAVGASPADIVRLIVGRAMLLVAVGAALGVGACLASGELLRKVVFGVAPGEPLILSAAALVMALAALIACTVPARRAATVDPLGALRAE
jgi:predicted permease